MSVAEVIQKTEERVEKTAARSGIVFQPDTVVYWCHNHGNGVYDVRYGIVCEQWFDKVVVNFLEPRERRRVNGIPIMEFEGEQRRKKLPKGWNYNTMLYEITYDELSPEEKEFCLDIRNPSSIKEAYSKGYIVERSKIFHGEIDISITKEGYKVIVRSCKVQCPPCRVAIEPYRLYFTFDEAQNEVSENMAEFERQADLSDYDWSVEQIDEVLGGWVYMYGKTKEEAESIVLTFLLKKCRGSGDTGFQWRYSMEI